MNQVEAALAEPTPADPAPVEQPQADPPKPPTMGISLWQPFATLIALGAKTIETRSWSTGFRGPIAILATADLKPESREAMDDPAIADVIDDAGFTLETLPLGCIVAVAELVECIPFTDGYDPGEPERHFGDFTPGRCGFRLENVRPLPEPIPAKGGQKIFALEQAAIDKLFEVMPTLKVIESEPPREKPALFWNATMEGPDEGRPVRWDAENTVGITSTQRSNLPAEYTIDLFQGDYKVYVEDEKLCPSESLPTEPFKTFEEAKAWCEAHNRSLLTASEPPADPEKVGSAGATDLPDVQTWHLIQAAREEERDAEEAVDSLTAELKAAKKTHEAASSRLGRLLDEAKHPTLFSKIAPVAPPASTPSADTTAGPTDAPAEDDSWRPMPVSALGLSDRVAKALAEHTTPLTTLGELSAWMEKKADWWAADIVGLGEKSRVEIEEAWLKFWTSRPEPVTPAPASAEASPADSATPSEAPADPAPSDLPPPEAQAAADVANVAKTTGPKGVEAISDEIMAKSKGRRKAEPVAV